MPSHPFECGREGSAKDFVRSLAKQLESPETLQMIQWISQPIISLQMGDLEICKHGLLHYLGGKGQVDIDPEPFIVDLSLILQCLDLLIHLLEMLSISTSLAW